MESDDGRPPAEAPVWTVQGDTRGDNVKALELRVYFVEFLLEDPRVILLFEAWGQKTGLYATAERAAAACEEFREDLGLPHWTALGPASVATEIPLTAFATYLQASASAGLPESALLKLSEIARCAQELMEKVERMDLGESAGEFVRDTLDLPWPWLAVDLVTAFREEVEARAFGIRAGLPEYEIEHGSPPAPPLRVETTFETREGETVAEAAERLGKAMTEHFEALGAAWSALQEAEDSYKSPAPRADLRDWAEWFYRARVKKDPDSIRSLGLEYVDGQQADGVNVSYDGRSQVQRGIQEAERLLPLFRVEPSPAD